MNSKNNQFKSKFINSVINRRYGRSDQKRIFSPNPRPIEIDPTKYITKYDNIRELSRFSDRPYLETHRILKSNGNENSNSNSNLENNYSILNENNTSYIRNDISNLNNINYFNYSSSNSNRRKNQKSKIYRMSKKIKRLYIEK